MDLLDESMALPERVAAAPQEPSLLEQEKKRLVVHSEEIKPLIAGLVQLERDLQIGYFLIK